MDVLIYFIGASHGMYHDFKSHKGAANTFGRGVVSSITSKQKLNMSSSTCSELVGVKDCMPKVSYFRLFLDA